MCRACCTFLCEHCTAEHRKDPTTSDHRIVHVKPTEYRCTSPLSQPPQPSGSSEVHDAETTAATKKGRRRIERIFSEPSAAPAAEVSSSRLATTSGGTGGVHGLFKRSRSSERARNKAPTSTGRTRSADRMENSLTATTGVDSLPINSGFIYLFIYFSTTCN